jgi:hypothetical protein
MQVSELLSVKKCDKAVMDFLPATGVVKFPPKMDGGGRAGGRRAAELVPAGTGRRNKSRRVLLDFIPFPLYSMVTFFCFLFFSFFHQKGDDG